MTTHWRLRIFGEPGLERDGRLVPFRTTRQMGVLVYLAFEGPAVRREQLVPLFWPAVPERKGRHSLTQAVSELSATVGELLVRDRRHIGLAPGLRTDLDLLGEDPGAATRGDVLAALDGLGGIELAQWLDGVRERIRREAGRVLEHALRRERTAGEGARAVALALARLDPCSTAAVTALAEQDLADGDRTGAVRRLRAHQRRLVRELGCLPEPRVQAVLTRLESGVLERARAAILGDALRIEAEPPHLVGREREVAQLDQVWSGVSGGASDSVALTGEAGIGKSSLMRQFLSGVAARAYPAFLITCHAAIRGVPFALLVELIDALSAEPGFAASEPAWLAEASRVHPVLRKQFPGVPAPPEAPPESIHERLVEALVEILATVAEGRSVVIGVDDADQGDETSLRILNLVRHRVRAHPLLIVAAAAGPEAPAGSLVAARHLVLGPLSDEAVAALIAPAGVGPDVQARIIALAGGNPFFALALVHDHGSLQAGGGAEAWTPPPTLVAAVERAVQRHSTSARRVLSALATAGQPASVTDVTTVTGLTMAEVRAAAVELLARGRLLLAGSEMRLASPLLQSAVYHLEPEPVRAYLHQCWAAAILAAPDLPEHVRLLQAALHEERAGRQEVAITAYRNGASAALVAGAPGEARSAVEAAMALVGRFDASLQLTLSETYAAQGNYETCVVKLAGIEDAPTLLAPNEFPRYLILRLEAAHRSGSAQAASLLPELDTVIESGSLENGELLLRAAQLRGELARDSSSESELAGTWAMLASMSTNQSQIERARTLLTKGFLQWQLSHFREARRLFIQATEQLADQRLYQEAARAANGAGISAYHVGDYADGFQHHRVSLRFAAMIEDRSTAVAAMTNAAGAMVGSGHLQQAKCLNELILEITARARLERRRAPCLSNYSDTLLLLGDSQGAFEACMEASAILERVGDVSGLIQAMLPRIDQALYKGDMNEASRLLADLRVRTRSVTVPWTSYARIHRQVVLVNHKMRSSLSPPKRWRAKGSWGVFARIETLAVKHWSIAVQTSDVQRVAKALAKGLVLHMPGPLNWLTATGFTFSPPWTVERGYQIEEAMKCLFGEWRWPEARWPSKNLFLDEATKWK